MKVLLVGVGGVGESIAVIAQDKPWLEKMVLATSTPSASGGAKEAARPRRSSRPSRSTPATAPDRRAGPEARGRPDHERRRAAVQRADLRRRLRARLHLHGHGHDALDAASGAAVRGARGQAGRLPVRARGEVGEEGPPGAPGDGRRARHGRRLRQVRREAPVRRDRRDRHPRRRQPRGPRLRVRPQLLDLDHDRGVPEPAGHLGEGARLVHHRAVLRAGGLRVPGGHRAAGVRQRRARGSAARAALGEMQARVTFKYGLGDDFIRVLKTIKMLGLDNKNTIKVGQGGGRAAGRRRRLPARPGAPGRPDVRQDVRRHLGQGQ